MKFKKLASLAVVAAMVFAMAAPAFAIGGSSTTPPANDTSGSDSSSGSGSSSGSDSSTPTEVEDNQSAVDVTSSVKTPTVKVEVANASAVILNPYRMTVTVSGEEYKGTFISTPVFAKNTSDVRVDVSVSAKVNVAGDVAFVNNIDNVSPESGTAQYTKNAYVDMAVGIVSDNTATITHAAGAESATGFVTTGHSDDTPKWKIVKFTAVDTAAGFGTGFTGDNAKTITMEAGKEEANYLGIQLFGELNANANTLWTENDKVSASIVLTFAPKALAAES